MKRRFPRALTHVVFAGILLLAIALATAGFWLNVPGEPKKSDAIVILAGDSERVFYGARLYRDGWAPEVYLSRAAEEPVTKKIRDLGIRVPSEAEIAQEILLHLEIPRERIHVFGPSISTAQEAESLERSLPVGAKFMVVTSPYHATRARLIFKSVFRDRPFEVVGDPEESFPKAWWKDQASARETVLEFVKLIYFELGGRFRR